MGGRKIEKAIKGYSRSLKKVTAKKKEENIAELLQLYASKPRRGNFFDFVFEQFGYLGRYCLVWQVLWAAGFCYLIGQGAWWMESVEHGGMILLSILPAILTLITVGEMTKVYQRSMLEIEYATKYSLENVVMVRMTALGVLQSVILLAGIVVVRARFRSPVVQLAVYGFTPMTAMAGILLSAMKYVKGEQLRGVGMAVYVAIVVFCSVGSLERYGIYRPDYFWVWKTVCVASVALVVYQSVKLKGKLKDFERMIG